MAARELATALAKKGGLTLAQLASYDDVLTDALVDRVYFWSTIRKNKLRFPQGRGIHEEDIATILREKVVVERDAKEATDKILQLSGIKKYVDRLRTPDEKEHFQRHLRKYVNIYMPDCPFEVNTTNRYTIDTHEASVTARKDIKKGDIIKYLCGIQVAITEDEFKALARDDVRLDFSIVHSSRKKTPSLFLGPARFANHDCNANARLSTTGSHGMQVLAAKDISVGDEITVTYGTDYFGEDNCECLCSTCERLRRNGWALHTGETEDEESGEELEDVEDLENTEGYSLRRKRSSEAMDEIAPSGSTTPEDGGKRRRIESPQPPIRLASDSPRGRRTTREVVTVKTEQTVTTQSVNDIPAATVQTEARITATIKVPVLTPGLKVRQTRARQLRESSDESDNSRSSSAATSSVFSAQSQSTVATSDGDISDSLDTKCRRDISSSSTGSVATVTQRLDIDITTKTTLKPEVSLSTTDAEDSDGELTPISQFSANSHTGEATRRSKSRTVKKKALNREVARLYEGDMARSIHQTFEIENANAVLTTETDITLTTTGRHPGDYTLTTKLLSGTYSRWVQCTTCDADFVQNDAYLTRKECPRCERHSKLYGYAWPKTDREGRWDTEERIMDHRTVHRFVEPAEERRIRKGGRKTLINEVLRRRASSSAERTRTASVGGVSTRNSPAAKGDASPRRATRTNRRSRLTM